MENNMGMKVGDTVWKISGKPFKSGEKEEKIVNFGINEQDPKKRRCAIFSDGSTCNLDLLFFRNPDAAEKQIGPTDTFSTKVVIFTS
jgi:hypothetical protein